VVCGVARPAWAVVLPPTSLTATATSSSSVALRWGDPNSTERGYSVERSLLPTAQFKRIKLLPANSVSYTDTGLAGGTTYYYRVTTAGTSKHSAVVPVTTGVGALPSPTPKPAGDTTAPSVPSGLSGSASSCTQVSLSWRASSDTGGSGLQGYRVFRNGV